MKTNLRAFSLIELLLVVAVIGTMATLVTPAIGDSSRRARFNRALAAVSSELEMAQQAAIAGSTYAWVGFAANDNKPMLVSARSLEGSGPSAAQIDLTDTSANAKATQIGRVQVLENVVLTNSLADSGSYTGLPEAFSTAKTVDASTIQLKARTSGSSGQIFNWVVEFNPMGEATVRTASGATPVEGIKLVIVPSANSSPSAPELRQAGAVWIDGISGKPTIYQK